MFDIRKIQEKVIYEAVKAESNDDVAALVVYGCEQTDYMEKQMRSRRLTEQLQ